MFCFATRAKGIPASHGSLDVACLASARDVTGRVRRLTGCRCQRAGRAGVLCLFTAPTPARAPVGCLPQAKAFEAICSDPRWPGGFWPSSGTLLAAVQVSGHCAIRDTAKIPSNPGHQVTRSHQVTLVTHDESNCTCGFPAGLEFHRFACVWVCWHVWMVFFFVRLLFLTL